MQTIATPTVTEHHPSCKLRCVSACGASPRRPHHDHDTPRPPRVRTFHTAAVAPLDKAPLPLWERIDDFEAVRVSGASIPLPETYTAHERADERYSLDRWTRADGLEDRALDAAIQTRDEARKSHARARDVEDVAALVRGAFAGILEGDHMPRVAVTRRSSARAAELLALVIGEAPPWPVAACQHVPMYEATAHIRDVFRAHAWALALILFGREKDPLSDYAFGRLFKGEPIRDLRAPFAGGAHALAVADHDLPGLGGGSCPWPQEDPRMARRTWSRPDEMKVSGAFHGSDRIRGEAAVHRVLDARSVERRAALLPHERAMVAVLNDRELTRDEKALRLREIEAHRRGIDPQGLVTAETLRLREMRRLTGSTDYDAKIAARQDIDALARPQLLRTATADVSDADLMRAARAVEKRVQAAVERESLAGDALAPKRVEKVRRVRPVAEPIPIRGRFASEMLGL